MDIFLEYFSFAQSWIFETIINPFVYYAGLGSFSEQAYDATEWLLVGMCELVLLYLLLRPLEAFIPVQAITDRRARWIDFIYTLIYRLGAMSLVVFFVLDPLFDEINSVLHLQGIKAFDLENLWTGVTDHPLASFVVYLVVLDFFDYWYHRFEHQFSWTWALHSLHHSQQNMNLWSDNRNHLLDDFIRSIFMAVIALGIGVQPAQYVLLVAFSRSLQSLQHANVRIHFGAIGERLLVSPRYHRQHHAIGLGHESAGVGTLGGHNFAVLFPLWDMLFGTALFSPEFAATGVRDQLAPPAGSGRDYGRGFWGQQWRGLQRMFD
jgi:sterol desaturase/sphingolipid hydroxylase (fatty acid hydroxylase superfamily)